MNECILNSFRKPGVAKTLRSNCEALSKSREASATSVPPVRHAQDALPRFVSLTQRLKKHKTLSKFA
jgi:hypothetical protein